MTKRKSWVACIYCATNQHYAASITLLAESMIGPFEKKVAYAILMLCIDMAYDFLTLSAKAA